MISQYFSKKQNIIFPFTKRFQSTQSFQIFEEINNKWKLKNNNKPKIQFKPKYKHVRLQYGTNARNSILKGIQRLATASSLTLGPGGRNIALEYEGGEPRITKDGVTVVKSVQEKIREHDMGARLIKQVAGNTNLYAGDGTTTSTLISKVLLEQGFRLVEFADMHPIGLKRGMEKGKEVVLNFLKEMSLPISTEEEIYNVCKVSSNYQEEASRVVAQSIASVGLDGTINIVESPTETTYFNLVNGLIFERGYVSEAFVTEFKIEQKCELENPLVLVVSNKIKEGKRFLKIMELVKKVKRPFVLFSEDVQEEPMSTMVYNNQKGIVNCCAVNVPWMGKIEKEWLKDIAVSTGATIIDDDLDLTLEDVQYKHFGSAKKIVVDAAQTHIVGGQGSQEDIDKQMDQIKYDIQQESKPNLKNIHKERYARMQAKIAEIQIGGKTEVEKGEMRDIIVDSLNSAKSAMTGGVLPGGGVALYQASKLLEKGLPEQITDINEQMGVQVLAKALKEPINKIINNKLGDSSSFIIQKIDQEEDFYYGYDVQKVTIEELCNMIDKGVVDSYNVIKVILQDSISLAGILLTTECLVIKEKPYERKNILIKHYQDRKQIF